MSEENQILEPESNTIPEQSAVNTDTDTSNKGEQTSEKTEEQVKLYAGKYKSVEDLENGYKNLEKKLGQKQPENIVKDSEKQATDNNYQDTSFDNVQNIAKEAGLDWEKLETEFYDNGGQINANTKKELISKGIPEEFIDQACAGLKAQADKEINMIAEVCGGRDEYNVTMEWAAMNLSEEEKDAIQKDLRNKPTITTGKAIISYLHNKRLEAEGITPKYLSGNASSVAGDYFESQAQVTAAMSDPRYKSGTKEFDPAYVKQVADKLTRSRKAGKNIFNN